MARVIGIRHRRKRTTQGEARPTMIAVQDGDKTVVHTLGSDEDELDFVLGRFPTSYREAVDGEDFSRFFARHVKRRKDKPTRVPASYDGFAEGDTVAMTLGGSGDRLAFALARRAEELNAKVLRLPPYRLSEARGEEEKEGDHTLLVKLVVESPHFFYEVTPRDLEFIEMREAYRARRAAQQDRIRCEQRLLQLVVGKLFLTREGRYPEGLIEELYDAEKATDATLQALLKEEARREAELRNAVHKLEPWQKIFEGIEGCGEVLAAGLMSAIVDIRRFEKPSRLVAFLGVHVLKDGRFPRRRRGERSNWQTEGRQTLFLLADQFNYRKGSVWGLYLRAAKVRYRERHPEPVEIAGKMRFTRDYPDASPPSPEKVYKVFSGEDAIPLLHMRRDLDCVLG